MPGKRARPRGGELQAMGNPEEQGVLRAHVDTVSLRPHLDEGPLLSLTSSPLWPGIPGGPGRPGLPRQPGSPSLWSPWEEGDRHGGPMNLRKGGGRAGGVDGGKQGSPHPGLLSSWALPL